MADDSPKVTLHWLNGSRAQSTLWLLEELQIPYELEIYHRQPSKLAPPKLAKVHPLGKSPVITIEVPGSERLVLAESGFIVQYLTEHFTTAKNLVPKRWKDGQEGKIGGETEEWMRYQYLMYYVEGSFMATFVMYYVLSALGGNNVPFFIRPLTRFIGNQVIAVAVFPNMKKHLALLEKYLETSANGEKYLCGDQLTGVDTMLAFALISGKDGLFDSIGKYDKGTFKATYPKLHAYSERLEQEPGWKRSVAKMTELEGPFSLLP